MVKYFPLNDNIFEFQKSIDKNNFTNVELFNYFIGEETCNIKLNSL